MRDTAKPLSILFAVLATAGLAGQAFAARIVGNGGDVVVCSGSYEVLDLYEARRMRQQLPDFGPVLEPVAMALHVVDRLAAVDPVRAALYRRWVQEFNDDSIVFNDNQHFSDINDSGDVLIQDGCRVVQIAVQREPRSPEDRRYMIDGSVWSHLGDADKAALILHEVIYRDALQRGHVNSMAARYFVGLYSWRDFAARIDVAGLQQRLRMKDMDAFIYEPDTPQALHSKYVYFDGLSLSFDDARRHCESLHNDSGVVGMADFGGWFAAYSLWKRSAIGERLLAAGSPVDELWVGPGEVGVFERELIRRRASSGPASVVCWVSDN